MKDRNNNETIGDYGHVVSEVTRYLEQNGAYLKGEQKTKKGWTLDGEIINLQPPNKPCWFAFNKFKKLAKDQPFTVKYVCNKFGLDPDQIRDTGAANAAIWIHCSVGEETLIEFIQWLRKQEL